MPDDRVKRFFRRFKRDDGHRTQHSFPTLRGKPRTEFGWNEFRLSLKNLLKSDLTEASYKAFLAPILLSEIDRELFIRWLQVICMLPLFRTTSLGRQANNPNVQTALQTYHTFSPYLNSVLALAREYKWPIIRSLDKLEPANSKARGIDDAFVIGSGVLIAPITNAGAVQRYVYLPAGNWYAYSSNVPYRGGQYVTVSTSLEQLPFFIKAGTALPVQQDDIDILVYRIYPGELETVLYEDTNTMMGQTEVDYRWIYITCGWDDGKFNINRRIAGQYIPPYTKIRVEIVDLPGEPTSINIDRRPAPVWYFDNGILEFTCDDFSRIELSFTE
ncbi:MAG: hypothetical protein LCI00_03885 [Chloroflexi bacterium]|nr:hypothetical protein [Chloroflexota bacterium]MCC6891237.1 hypothetical protein [Anaerolineae bacterium]